jgi:hypothetical protein
LGMVIRILSRLGWEVSRINLQIDELIYFFIKIISFHVFLNKIILFLFKKYKSK